MRKTSPNGLKFLEGNEGRKCVVYPDDSGYPTVGVGHKVRPEDNLKLGDNITEERVEKLLAGDVGVSENAINGAIEASRTVVVLTQNMFDSLVSLTFNIGVAGFLKSTVLADLLAGNIADERRAFEMWDKDMQDGHLVVSKALLSRRDREVALFLTPDAAPQAVGVADAPPVLPDDGQPTPPSDMPPPEDA
jgi:lysozyme